MTTNNTNHDTSGSNSALTDNDWESYGGTEPVYPWDKIPGCEDWDIQEVFKALNAGAKLYRAPDSPEVREHNQAQRQRWDDDEPKRRAEDEKRKAALLEIRLKGDATDNKRLAGYARKSIKGIINDVVRVQNGPYWGPTLYLKGGQLAAWFDLGYGFDTESDAKAALLEAAAPWNAYEERSAETQIGNGWANPIPPAIPDDILAHAKPQPGSGINAEVRTPVNGNVFHDDGAGDGGGQIVSATQTNDSVGTDELTPLFADTLLSRSDLRNLPVPQPLIDNVLDQGTIALLYGKWSTAKTFIALDWAACVATGKRWQTVRPSSVECSTLWPRARSDSAHVLMRGKWPGNTRLATSGCRYIRIPST